MSGNFPEGVTGNEPMIVGTKWGGACSRCTENASEDADFAGLNDAVMELAGEHLCRECIAEDIECMFDCNVEIVSDQIYKLKERTKRNEKADS